MQVQRQSGISLVGLIVVIAILGFVGVLGMKIIPTYTEYRAILGAIERAKRDSGGSAKAIQDSYNKSAEVGYITSLKSSDLIIDRQDGEVEISFEYEKKIPLFGPASILLEYSGTTAKGGAQKKAEE